MAGPAAEVVVATAAKQDVEIYSEWVGTTNGNVNAQIYPKVQGYLIRQAYRDGSVVQEGDLLFEIDPRQFQASLDEATGQLARARASLVKYETDVVRYTPLAAEGAVSQQELDNAVQARAGSAAEVDSARAAVEQAQLNLQWTKVKSPITGVVAIATVQVGDLVSPADAAHQRLTARPDQGQFPDQRDRLPALRGSDPRARGDRPADPDGGPRADPGQRRASIPRRAASTSRAWRSPPPPARSTRRACFRTPTTCCARGSSPRFAPSPIASPGRS